MTIRFLAKALGQLKVQVQEVRPVATHIVEQQEAMTAELLPMFEKAQKSSMRIMEKQDDLVADYRTKYRKEAAARRLLFFCESRKRKHSCSP